MIDDLEQAAADELFVFDQRNIGLDPGGVAVHHKGDGAGGLKTEICEFLTPFSRSAQV